MEETVRISEHLATSGQLHSSAASPGAPEILPCSTPSSALEAVHAPRSSSASETLPAPTSCSTPETVPAPNSSGTSETVSAQTPFSAKETFQTQIKPSSLESHINQIRSTTPESVQVPTSFKSLRTLPDSSKSRSVSSGAFNFFFKFHFSFVNMYWRYQTLRYFFPEFATLQKKLRVSLHRTWKNALTLDWISPEKAKSLPLLEFYTGLRWTKMVKALKNYKVELNSIYDILKIIDPNEELRPVNIFIEG